MYLAIEGIKGSGKSTLFDRLVSDPAIAINQFSILRPTVADETNLVDRMFKRFCQRCPDIVVERMFARRSNRASRQVPKRTNLILGERSLITSYVTRWDADDPEAGMGRVDKMHSHIRLPDYVLYLAIDPRVAAARIAARPARTYGVHDETLARLYEADRIYRYLAVHGAIHGMAYVRWAIVDASAPVDQVFAHVRMLVTDQLAVMPNQLCEPARFSKVNSTKDQS